MNKYNFDITIEAASQKDAMTKMLAATVLMQKLKPHELKKLADVAKNDPNTMALAKKYLGL